mgnify:CR=1 FL=1
MFPATGRPAWGELDDQGRFRMTTYEGHDGCVVGTHRVAIVAMELISESEQRWHAPQKYAHPDTSGLTVEITGQTDSLAILLTSDSDGHE